MTDSNWLIDKFGLVYTGWQEIVLYTLPSRPRCGDGEEETIKKSLMGLDRVWTIDDI